MSEPEGRAKGVDALMTEHWKIKRSIRVMVVHVRWMNHSVNGFRNLLFLLDLHIQNIYV